MIKSIADNLNFSLNVIEKIAACYYQFEYGVGVGVQTVGAGWQSAFEVQLLYPAPETWTQA